MRSSVRSSKKENIKRAKCDETTNTGEFVLIPDKRGRGQTVNLAEAFQELRKHIPTEPVDKKLSKYEILQLAVSYITHLDIQRMCQEAGVPEHEYVLCSRVLPSSGRCTFCITRQLAETSQSVMESKNVTKENKTKRNQTKCATAAPRRIKKQNIVS